MFYDIRLATTDYIVAAIKGEVDMAIAPDFVIVLEPERKLETLDEPNEEEGDASDQ